MDEFDSNTTPDSASQNEQHAEGSSRRTFLKAAVVGSAAAVAVSGVGAATLTLTGHHTGLKKYLALTTDTISGITSDSCTTDSTDNPKSCFGPDTVFFWAKFNGVPAGTYTLDVSPTIPTSLIAFPPSQGQSSAFVQVVGYPGGASFSCHPLVNGQPSLPTTGFLAQQNTLSVTVNPASDGDILLWLHLKPQGTGSVTLTATLYQGNNENTPVDSTALLTFKVGQSPQDCS